MATNKQPGLTARLSMATSSISTSGIWDGNENGKFTKSCESFLVMSLNEKRVLVILPKPFFITVSYFKLWRRPSSLPATEPSRTLSPTLITRPPKIDGSTRKATSFAPDFASTSFLTEASSSLLRGRALVTSAESPLKFAASSTTTLPDLTPEKNSSSNTRCFFSSSASPTNL